jgi:hypothetical protein
MTAVGVAVVSWIARQIQQSIREAQLLAFQNTVGRHQQWYQDVARDAELARIYADGLSDPASLDRIDLVRFEALSTALFRNWEDEFLHYERGMVEEDIFHGRRMTLRLHIREPGMKWFWNKRFSHFTRPFQKYVQGEIKAVPLEEPSILKPGVAELIRMVPGGPEPERLP